ncbi:MAG: S49 family peptidase, partial [Chlamydiota bacterium]
MNPINNPKESIFSSSIRSFCNAFFCVLGIILCFYVIGFIMQLGVGSDSSKTSFVIQPDADGKRTSLQASSPIILKITIDGIIGTGELITSAIETTLLDSREDRLKNNRVKAIFLHVDTPGGTVTDSNGIYEALMAYKTKYNIPIFAFVDGTCASGGMYITSAADRIYASSVSVVGSVGVILGPVFNFYDLMDNWGIKSKTISKGKDKTMLNPFTKWQPGEDDSLYKMTDYLYEHFISIV